MGAERKDTRIEQASDEEYHIPIISSDSQTGFYFPPSALADGPPFLSRTGKYRFFAFVGPLAFWRAKSDKTIEQNVYIFINIRIKSTFADGVNPEEVHRFAKPYRLRVGKPAARGCAKPPVLQEDGMFSYKKICIPKLTKGKSSIRCSFLERKGGPFVSTNGG